MTILKNSKAKSSKINEDYAMSKYDQCSVACSVPSGETYSLACSYACRHMAVQLHTQDGMHHVQTEGQKSPSTIRCMQGFSERQINILGVLKEYKEILSYRSIAELVTGLYGLETTEGQARGALSRLRTRKILTQKRGQVGRNKGNFYLLLRDPCEHIRPCSVKGVAIGVSQQAHVQESVDSRQNATLYSIEKLDRKRLSSDACKTDGHMCTGDMESLNEADIALYWPCLAAAGFGTNQLRQVTQRLQKAGITRQHVVQGLHYAEWDLAHGTMRTAKGEAVASPTNWTFSILVRQGYYPRPQDYTSPEEQAERDAQVERARLKALRDLRQQEEFALWEEGLSQVEREHIIYDVTKGRGASDKTPLRIFFKERVWRECLSRQKNDDGDASVET